MPRTKHKNESHSQFHTLVKGKLSVFDYENLPSVLGISVYKLNKVFKNPEQTEFTLVQKLAVLLDITVVELANKYRLGFNKLTLADLDQTKKSVESGE